MYIYTYIMYIQGIPEIQVLMTAYYFTELNQDKMKACKGLIPLYSSYIIVRKLHAWL